MTPFAVSLLIGFLSTFALILMIVACCCLRYSCMRKTVRLGKSRRIRGEEIGEVVVVDPPSSGISTAATISGSSETDGDPNPESSENSVKNETEERGLINFTICWPSWSSKYCLGSDSDGSGTRKHKKERCRERKYYCEGDFGCGNSNGGIGGIGGGGYGGSGGACDGGGGSCN